MGTQYPRYSTFKLIELKLYSDAFEVKNTESVEKSLYIY